MSAFIHNIDTFTFVIVPLLIFFARIIDVSMGTLRVVFISRGYRLFAACLGFVEVLVWLVAIRNIFHNLTNVLAYIGYAGGFATGTYIGMYIEEKLSIGRVMVRAVIKKNARKVLRELKKTLYSITTIDGVGNRKKVKVLFMFVKRHDAQKIINIIKTFDPNTFYTVEDIRYGTEETISCLPYKRRNHLKANNKKK